MECSIYRGSDSRDDDRCLPLPSCCVFDVGQCSAGLLCNLDKDKMKQECEFQAHFSSFYTSN